MKTPFQKIFIIITASIFGVLSFATQLKPESENNFPQKMLVTVPIADVRDKPKINKNASYETLDWEQVTQVIYGEKIVAYEKRNGWLRIKTPEQKICVKEKWYECAGWINESHVTPVKEFPKYNLIVKEPSCTIFEQKKKNKQTVIAVSIGTQLQGTKYHNKFWEIKLPNGKIGSVEDNNVYDIYSWKKRNSKLLRKSILHTAHLFLNSPYLWGGRSFYNKNLKNQLSSSDCSGLVDLCHKIHGIELPRNSRSQYIKSKKIYRRPNPGDLIFLSRSNKLKDIYHVMIYIGHDKIIEAKGNNVRKIRMTTGKKELGKQIKKITSGEKIQNDFVYFGTYL
mgnify:CR=1 FL=1|jgi:cell wall-associated NlpC family hydrolase